MEASMRTDQVGIWGRLSAIVVIFVIGCVWIGAGRIDRAMAQASAPNPATGGQAQPAAAPPAGVQGQASTAPTAAPTAAAGQSKEAEPYMVGRWVSFAIAIGFLLVVLLLTVMVKSGAGINFFQSPDGAVSVSKVQVWVWTMAIIFAYVYLFLWQGPPEKFPDSLWELMGISALSTGTARYIAVVSGKTPAPPPEVKEKIKKQNWLVSMLSDDGEPSMMRLQMFGWTLVTVFLFLMYVDKEQKLWDVPQTLVILMGISHAGYLGDKGAAAAKPN